MPSNAVREATVLTAVPLSLAASGDQLVIMMEPDGTGRSNPVYSLTTHRNPSSGAYYDTPLGRLDVLPSALLPAGASSMAADRSTVLALASGDPPQLFRLGVSEWSVEGLPDEVGAHARISTWVTGGDRRLGIAWVNGGSLEAFVARASAQIGAPESWDRVTLPGAGTEFLFMVDGASCNAIVRRAATGAHELCYAGPQGVRVLATIPPQASVWTVLGVADEFLLAHLAPRGELTLARIDPLNGSIAEAAPLVREIPRAFEWIHLPLLGGATIAMLLAGFVIKPPIETRRHLVAGWLPLSMMRRTLALGIDLVPGAILALLVTGERVEALLAMPSWTPELSRCVPATIMLGTTGAWCALFEAVWRASPGKWLVGARVIRAESKPRVQGSVAIPVDARAGVGRTLLRAALKSIVLMAPALGVLSFVHPLHQGVPESLTGTAVARRGTQQS